MNPGETQEERQRSMISPPIRYLLESEEWSHCMGRNNQSRAQDMKRSVNLGRPKREKEEEDMVLHENSGLQDDVHSHDWKRKSS